MFLRRAVHNDGIEAIIHLGHGVILDEMGGDFVELAALGHGDSFFRGTELVGVAGFHFHEDDEVAIAADDVDLTALGAEVAHQDGEALLFQIFGGNILTPIAKGFFVFGHELLLLSAYFSDWLDRLPKLPRSSFQRQRRCSAVDAKPEALPQINPRRRA